MRSVTATLIVDVDVEDEATDEEIQDDCKGVMRDLLQQRMTEVVVGDPTTACIPDTWPNSDADRTAYVDWQYEVANGDTILGFRPWLAHQFEASGT